MDEPFLGTVVLFAGNFAPRGWAFCQGQLLPIAQNTALFSLLGTTFGGDGQTTFALPDLRGCVPVGTGQGNGLSNRTAGERGGQEQVTLTAAQMPAHNHQVTCQSASGDQSVPNGNSPAAAAQNRESGAYVDSQYAAATNSTMAPGMIGPSGGNQPHENMPPFLAMNYIIALEGIYPSRN
jgi:microcystin-dependent protein